MAMNLRTAMEMLEDMVLNGTPAFATVSIGYQPSPGNVGSGGGSSGGSQDDDELSDEELRQVNAEIVAQLFENINAAIAQGGAENGSNSRIADMIFDLVFGATPDGGTPSGGSQPGTASAPRVVNLTAPFPKDSTWTPPAGWWSANRAAVNMDRTAEGEVIQTEMGTFYIHFNGGPEMWEIHVGTDSRSPPARYLVRGPDGHYYWAPPRADGKPPKPGYKITLTVQDADGSSHAVDFVSGSSDDDVITGSGFLSGDDGDDTITGDIRSDVLKGGAGNDILNGGAGDDLLLGGAGADRLLGGAGFDTVSYEDAAAGITATLAFSGSWDGDQFDSIEALSGSAFADRLIGHAGSNKLSGQAGNDSLEGGDGDDTLDGGNGNDVLFGDAGADALLGDDGNDTLQGGTGHDWLDGGAGADQIDGGEGWDVVSYQSATGGVTVDLTSNTNAGAATGDRILNVEVLQGSNHADRLTGLDRGNGNGVQLYGEGGDDGLTGKAGGDALFGGAGNDWLDGGPGGDLLDGGAGWDVLSYQSATGGVVVDLTGNQNGGAAAGDQVSNIEVLQGSNYADTLTSIDRGGGSWAQLYGEGGNDTLYGRGGGDYLFGGSGNDWLDGGFGSDVLNGGEGLDSFAFTSALGAGNVDTIQDFAAGDTIALSSAVFAQAGSYNLAGTAFRLGTAATTTAHRIVYDQATGDLFYDADGVGGAAQVKVAVLANHAQLSAANFLIW
ncbi:calcium-binding protein [Microvirga terrae]|uniref:calcium-binding protein n=1 Tax=Microvirga terrae TaxID=2740529 RepID=UPI0025599372|nr:calcium-binding protein [Microvirga terrae]